MIKYSFVQRRNNTVKCTTPPPLLACGEVNVTEETLGAASKPMALHLVTLFALLFILIMSL